MSGSHDTNPFSLDKWFGSLSFFEHPLLKESPVQKYVQDVLKRSMPQIDQLFPGAQPKADVFETHRSVIVRVRLSNKTKASQVRVRHNAHQVKIDGLADERTMNIRLPAIVSTRKSRCQIRDGILEIRLLKRPNNGGERDLYVEY